MPDYDYCERCSQVLPCACGKALAVAKPPEWDLISSEELARSELPELKWAVPGIVPEGVMLLAGKAKFGKSWWVLDLCVAVATGGRAWGHVAVEQGQVLYVTYEDSHRRIQERQRRVLGHGRGVSGLDFVTRSPRADKGGTALVLEWVRTHPRARLIAIDPLELWRPEEDSRKQLYRQDYESLQSIVELARSLGISVIIVHHVNKMVSPENPFDAISGSTGLQGVVDALGVFRTEQGAADAVLFLQGKDVERAELAFKQRINHDWPAPTWELIGSGDAYRLGHARFETLEALWREPWQTPRSLAEVVEGVTNGTMRKRLFDMAAAGLVRVRDGKYAAAMEKDTYLREMGLFEGPSLLVHGNTGNTVTPELGNTTVPSVPTSTDSTNNTAITSVTTCEGWKVVCQRPRAEHSRYCLACANRKRRGDEISSVPGEEAFSDGG